MGEKLKNKYVLFAIVAATFFSVLILNDSFRATFVRRRAIHQAQREIEKIDQEIGKLKGQLASLETTPHSHEDLVRRELGYIKPGEKEIRFVHGQNNLR